MGQGRRIVLSWVEGGQRVDYGFSAEPLYDAAGAARAGLGVMAHTRGLVPPGLSQLPARAGLPDLGDVDFEIGWHMAPDVWGPGAEFHLYDANGVATKYSQKYYEEPPKWPDTSSFCGNLPLLRQMLEYNGVRGWTVFDAAERPLSKLPGPYDLIYGFYSIGFHWSLDHYLDELDPLLGPETVLVCTLNKHFRPFERLRGFSTRVLECREIKKNSPPLHLLVLSKGKLPEVGASLAEAY